jgi:hypothetical protein
VRCQVSPTSEKDCGIIIEGYYRIDNFNSLRVFDMSGKLLGTQPIKPDDNAGLAAKRLLREGSDVGGFYRPLPSYH